MSQSTPGTLCLRTWSAPGSLYMSAQSTLGTQIKLYEFLENSGPSNKKYPVCSGTSNNNLFADFQLSNVKKL